MTADENAALIRRGYEAFNSGAMNTLNELLRTAGSLRARSIFATSTPGDDFWS